MNCDCEHCDGYFSKVPCIMQFHHHYRSGRLRFKFRVILTSYFMFFLAALLILSGILILFKVSPTNTPSFPVSLDYALSFLQTLEFRRFRFKRESLSRYISFPFLPKCDLIFNFLVFENQIEVLTTIPVFVLQIGQYLPQ